MVTASITVGGASSIAGSGWVGGVGVLADRSPAPQRLTGVRESTAPSLVVGVELSPAGSVPADVMDPALAPPLTGASDGSLLLEWASVEVVTVFAALSETASALGLSDRS